MDQDADARLHLEDSALRSFQKGFAPGAKLHFHMAPPLFSFLKTSEGNPRKIAVPGILAVPVLKLLRAMRPLRGTILDIFGLTHERRKERRLISEYGELIEGLLPTLSSGTLQDAVEIANLADMIRGYGHVKEAALSKYRLALADRLARHRKKCARPDIPESALCSGHSRRRRERYRR